MQRYQHALEDLVESRQRNLPRYKRLAKISSRQQLGVNCARTGQAGLCVVAAGMLLTPFAPSITLTVAAIGASSLATTATDEITSWVIGEQLADLTEEDVLLAQIAWDARKAYLAEINKDQPQLEPPQELPQLEDAPSEDREAKKKEKKKKKKEERKKKKKQSKYYVTEVAERHRKEKAIRNEEKRKRKEKERRLLALENLANAPDKKEAQPDWWLVPESMSGGNVTTVKENGNGFARTTAASFASQGVVALTGKLAGKGAGLTSSAAISVGRAVNCWKTENPNKMEAQLWHHFLATSLPMISAELRGLKGEPTGLLPPTPPPARA